jgi:ParB family transcriptional regulator, chromosome partitioning protein
MTFTDEWYTPLWLLNRVQDFFEHDFIDPATCNDAQLFIKAKIAYSKENNGLIHPWYGRIWLNPPYSQPLIRQFTSKLIAEYQSGNVSEALLLVNSCTDTKWFYKVAACCDRRLDICGRLHFWHPTKKSDKPRHGQTLFYFGKRCFDFLTHFGDIGLVWQLLPFDRPLSPNSDGLLWQQLEVSYHVFDN